MSNPNKVEWALHLLQDQNFLDLIADLKTLQLDRFENSREYDIEDRQNAYYKLSAINDIVSAIEGIASQKIINEKRFKIF